MRIAGYIGLGAVYVLLSAAAFRVFFWPPKPSAPIQSAVTQTAPPAGPATTVEQPVESDDEFRMKRCDEMVTAGKNQAKAIAGGGYPVTMALSALKDKEMMDLLPYVFPHLTIMDMQAVVVSIFGSPTPEQGIQEIKNRCWDGELSKEYLERIRKKNEEDRHVDQ